MWKYRLFILNPEPSLQVYHRIAIPLMFGPMRNASFVMIAAELSIGLEPRKGGSLNKRASTGLFRDSAPTKPAALAEMFKLQVAMKRSFGATTAPVEASSVRTHERFQMNRGHGSQHELGPNPNLDPDHRNGREGGG